MKWWLIFLLVAVPAFGKNYSDFLGLPMSYLYNDVGYVTSADVSNGVPGAGSNFVSVSATWPVISGTVTNPQLVISNGVVVGATSLAEPAGGSGSVTGGFTTVGNTNAGAGVVFTNGTLVLIGTNQTGSSSITLTNTGNLAGKLNGSGSTFGVGTGGVINSIGVTGAIQNNGSVINPAFLVPFMPSMNAAINNITETTTNAAWTPIPLMTITETFLGNDHSFVNSFLGMALQCSVTTSGSGAVGLLQISIDGTPVDATTVPANTTGLPVTLFMIYTVNPGSHTVTGNYSVSNGGTITLNSTGNNTNATYLSVFGSW